MDLAEVGEVTFTSADRVRGVVHNFYTDGKKLDAAVAVIAALHHDNPVLREHLDSHTGKLDDLDERRADRAGRGPSSAPADLRKLSGPQVPDPQHHLLLAGK
ncbi:hypothetical protein MOV08_07080 [Streptomyces yunnanensis]|uniref:Uncharacterized protein n=1 Tax=Streptomyces yunnanensis TaxID=156453 RepID=A0ABY8A306_9ACTN|nr:hypothetical protein [Streptomyces yunnanensis]WEB39079.1 hypothetical protein MOV08_07080 [Streptomyces yunnanensis]